MQHYRLNFWYFQLLLLSKTQMVSSRYIKSRSQGDAIKITFIIVKTRTMQRATNKM